jgi:hypothetical protein
MIQMIRCKVINTQSINNKKQYLFVLKKKCEGKRRKTKKITKNIDKNSDE